MPIRRAATAAERTPNKRGQGGRLRSDIVAAAASLLRNGGPQAITLRAVARDVGIAPTSIYDHFADREEILDALADRTFGQMADATERALAEHADPVEALLAGCRAYLGYAAEYPHLYALLFATAMGPAPNPGLRTPKPFRQKGRNGQRLFDSLVNAIRACAEAGLSASTDSFADAIVVWSALHGYASLRANMRAIPWPDDDRTVSHIVTDLAHLQHLGGPDAPRSA